MDDRGIGVRFVQRVDSFLPGLECQGREPQPHNQLAPRFKMHLDVYLHSPIRLRGTVLYTADDFLTS